MEINKYAGKIEVAFSIEEQELIAKHAAHLVGNGLLLNGLKRDLRISFSTSFLNCDQRICIWLNLLG